MSPRLAGFRLALVLVRLICLLMIGVFGWLVLLARDDASRPARRHLSAPAFRSASRTRKCPADLPPRAEPAASITARQHLAAAARIPADGRRAWPAVPATYHPHECRLPAGFTLSDTIGIGAPGGVPGAYQMRPRPMVYGGRGGTSRTQRRGVVAHAPGSGAGRPFLTTPELLGPCARARERASKHGANMGTKRMRKKNLE